MPLGPESTIDGVYKYGETVPTGPLFSDFLNLLGDSIRTKLANYSAGKIGDSGWIAYAGSFTNGWTASSGYPIEYRKLNGTVFWRGRLGGGSTGVALTIPAGYRPSVPPTAHTWAAAQSSTALTVITVLNATPTQLTVQSGVTINLASLTYPADA